MLERVFFLLLGAWLMNEYWGEKFRDALDEPPPRRNFAFGLMLVAMWSFLWGLR